MSLRSLIFSIISTLFFVFLTLVALKDCSKDAIITSQEDELIILKKELEEYKVKFELLDSIYNYNIDSLIRIKNNTVIIYEQVEKDFSDSAIIDDDSILSYITSQIQD